MESATSLTPQSTCLKCIKMFHYPVNMNMDITGFSFFYHSCGNWVKNKGVALFWAKRKSLIHTKFPDRFQLALTPFQIEIV